MYHNLMSECPTYTSDLQLNLHYELPLKCNITIVFSNNQPLLHRCFTYACLLFVIIIITKVSKINKPLPI